MTSSISSASIEGFHEATAYDRYRPSYPIEAVNSLLRHLQVYGIEGACIVDLAAGTGKFTELLANRAEKYEIIAVEPHDEMRAKLQQKDLKSVKALDGTATSMKEIESQSVDAIIVAQAFHWFANLESLKEIYRILIPGGILGMIWNVEDYNAPESWMPTTEWERKLKEITWSFGNEDTRFRHDQWRQVFEEQVESTPYSIQSADPLFSLPLGKESMKWTHWRSPDDLWERYHTLSQFAVLERDELENTKDKVFGILAEPEVERNDRGNLAIHGQTFFAWTTAVPGTPLDRDGQL